MKKTVSIRLIILIALLIFAAEIFYNFYYPERSHYFLEDNDGNVTFNTTLLQNIYKKYSSIPYNYCQGFQSKKTSDAYRIILIGEASLAGWPYSKEQSIGKKVEYNLKRFAPDKKFEVITVSFAGFNSYHAIDIISQSLVYKPDLIILYIGHNEFYGYKGSVSKFELTKLLTFNSFEKIFRITGINKSFKYDNYTDDFELMLPLCMDNKFIYRDEQVYQNTITCFSENISHIVKICKESKTGLILTQLADNNLLPPIGISSLSGQLSADIIFNNARMALTRDGNENEAEKLFDQSKDLDAFRLRVPESFSNSIEKIASKSNLTTAEIPRTFSGFSQNHIPGNELFVDYIHPNLVGLDIIAAEYSRLILNKVFYNSVCTIECLLENLTTMKFNIENDCSLEKKRIGKASMILRNANLLQNIAPASLD